MSSPSYEDALNIRICSSKTEKFVHLLPLPVTEDKLVEASKRTYQPHEDFYTRFMEKLHTFQEGSVIHKDDLCAVFPKRNVINQLYELTNVLEALGYLRREGAGKIQWFGPDSDRAAKTLMDLKTIAINRQEEDGSFDIGDVKLMTIPVLAEIVMMIFISLGHNITITRHELFSLIFKNNNENHSTVALKLPKVLKVFEVLGIIVHDFPTCDEFPKNTAVKYRYVGPGVEYSEFFELEETVKIEVDTENVIIVDEDEFQLLIEETVSMPEKEIVLEASGSWTIRDYVPVTYSSKDQRETSPRNEDYKNINESSQVRENCYVGLVDVKDEAPEEADITI